MEQNIGFPSPKVNIQMCIRDRRHRHRRSDSFAGQGHDAAGDHCRRCDADDSVAVSYTHLANLIDKVSIVIKRAAFEGNSERLEHAQSCMALLFTYVTSGDGFYKDGSFIQHTSIPYNGSYGFVLLDE